MEKISNSSNSKGSVTRLRCKRPGKKKEGKARRGDDCAVWVLDVKSTEDCLFSAETIAFLKSVFEKMTASSLSPKWISEEECLTRTKRANEIFVLPDFVGPVFEHLRDAKCRMYGPLAVFACLESGDKLPKWTHPILSITLTGAVVCFTGVDYAIREAKFAQVLYMNGTVSKDFNDQVTHLITSEHNPESKKYQAAAECSVPVMSVEWLNAAWAAVQSLNPVCFTDSEVVEMHRLPIFSGCWMTCSGVAVPERSVLAQLAEQHGAVFRAEMEKRKCTHLLTNKNSGEKYRKAREWEIKVVTTKWLHSSISKGYRLLESDYEPRSACAVSCSTPQQSRAATPADLEISSILGPQRRPGMEIADVSASTPTLSALLKETREKEKVPPTPRNAANVSVVPPTPLVTNKVDGRCNSPPRKCDGKIFADPIDTFNITALQSDDFLEGCRIFVCGVEAGKVDRWKRLVNLTGASRCATPNHSTTHIVIGPATLDALLIDQLKEYTESACFVKSEWLVECARQRRMVSTAEFGHVLGKDGAKLGTAKENFAVGERRASRRNTTVRDFSAFGPSTSKAANAHIVDERSLPNSKSTKTSRLEERRSLNGQSEAVVSAPVDATTHGLEDGKADGGVGEGTAAGDEGGDLGLLGFFAGLSFRILNMNELIADEMQITIARLGGVCDCDGGVHVTYAVLPMVHFDDPLTPADCNCEEVVSAFWVQDCIEKEAVFPPSRHPLYRPMPAKEGSTVLRGCVVALSTLSAIEKDAFTELLDTFGAVVQNRLAKSDLKGLTRNTHLVAGAESERTNTARKWKIPVVDPSWIVQSIIENRKMPEESFPFSDRPFKNYTRSDSAWLKGSSTARPSGGAVAEEAQLLAPNEAAEDRGDGGDFVHQEFANEPVVQVEPQAKQPTFAADHPDDGNNEDPEKAKAVTKSESFTGSLPDSMIQRLIELEQDVERSFTAPVPATAAAPVTPIVQAAQMSMGVAVNNRVKAIRESCVVGANAESPIVDTPSKFLDPERKFIPRFDLRAAEAFVNSVNTPPQSSLNSSWNESAVGRLLEEAVVKTARPRSPSKHLPFVVETVGEERRMASIERKRKVTSSSSSSLAGKAPMAGPSGKGQHTLTVEESKAVRRSSRESVRTSKEKDEEFRRLVMQKFANLSKAATTIGVSSVQNVEATTSLNRKRRLNADASANEETEEEKMRKMLKRALTDDTESVSSEGALQCGVIGWEEKISSKGPPNCAVTDSFFNPNSLSQAKGGQPAVAVPSTAVGTTGKVDSERRADGLGDAGKEASRLIAPDRGPETTDAGGPTKAPEAKRDASVVAIESPDNDVVFCGEQAGKIVSPRRSATKLDAPLRVPSRGSRDNDGLRNGVRPSAAVAAAPDHVLPSTSKEREKPMEKRRSMEKPKRFLFTSIADPLRHKFSQTVARLGGEVLSEFDDRVTHLVCGQVVRNEKVLASVAAGLLVIVPEYITDSDKANAWLNAYDYEWGNPSVIESRKFTNPRMEILARASRRWRLSLAKSAAGAKAFSGWNVLLYCSRKRAVDVIRIIGFGGGIAKLRDDVRDLDGFTLALVERSKFWNTEEIEELVRKKIPAFGIEYVAEYLIVENICERNFFHKDYALRVPPATRN